MMLGFRFRTVCLAAAVVLAGCHGLERVRYDQPATVTSTRSAEVRLVSGIIEGEPYPLLIGPLLLPAPVSSSSSLSFNAGDQRTFVLSLVDQLNRLKIVNAREAGQVNSEGADLLVQVTFLRTDERSAGAVYALDVEMLLSSGEQNATERYTILSSEGQSIIEQTFTRPVQAKERAANKLLAAVIPDIEKFLSRIK
jgi:hypothetical protein